MSDVGDVILPQHPNVNGRATNAWADQDESLRPSRFSINPQDLLDLGDDSFRCSIGFSFGTLAKMNRPACCWGHHASKHERTTLRPGGRQAKPLFEFQSHLTQLSFLLRPFSEHPLNVVIAHVFFKVSFVFLNVDIPKNFRFNHLLLLSIFQIKVFQ